MRYQYFIRSVCILALPLMTACGSDTVAVAGLVVDVYDSQTLEPAAVGATLIAWDDSYADTVALTPAAGFVDSPCQHVSCMYRTRISAVENRPGTYDVTITKPGYHVWHRENVRVPPGEESIFDASTLPDPVYLTAELEPLNLP